MNDRELLELAAKAAGITGTYFSTFAGDEAPLSDGEGPWNHLTDDGDALRLAVSLGLVVDCSRPSAALPFQRHAFGQGDYTDPFGATRRAIVRAAAEIGKKQ